MQLYSTDNSIKNSVLLNLKEKVKEHLGFDDVEDDISHEMKHIIDKEGGFGKFVDNVAEHFLKEGDEERQILDHLERQLAKRIKEHAKALLKKAFKQKQKKLAEKQKEEEEAAKKYEADEDTDSEDEDDSDDSDEGESMAKEAEKDFEIEIKKAEKLIARGEEDDESDGEHEFKRLHDKIKKAAKIK